ncbi:MAG: lipocalin-like domain-containing protein, partial [Pseudomonadota bacterium]
MYRLMRLAIAIIALVACSEQPTVEPDNQVLNVSWLNSEGKKADPAYAIQFPRDHASHPEFDIEWWYLTSNLTDEAGNHYALQWTLFRFKDGANASPWTNGHIFMGHASLHSAEKHWFSEKFAGAGLGNAGIEESPFRYYID